MNYVAVKANAYVTCNVITDIPRHNEYYVHDHSHLQGTIIDQGLFRES